jgi:hypothetical protein
MGGIFHIFPPKMSGAEKMHEKPRQAGFFMHFFCTQHFFGGETWSLRKNLPWRT